RRLVSDWSSDVCSSDLFDRQPRLATFHANPGRRAAGGDERLTEGVGRERAATAALVGHEVFELCHEALAYLRPRAPERGESTTRSEERRVGKRGASWEG